MGNKGCHVTGHWSGPSHGGFITSLLQPFVLYFVNVRGEEMCRFVSTALIFDCSR